MIFYIDTTSDYLYSCIYQDGKVLTELKKKLEHDLSVYSVDEINKMMESINIKPIDIDKIIVVTGPGSFTGIRIGVTIAKIFAYTLNKKITTITSLDAMANSINTDDLIVPLIDARRGYVYAKIIDHDNIIMEDSYLSLEKLLLILNGLNKKYGIITNNHFDFETKEYSPNFKKIIDKYKDKENINPHLVNPTYFKLTEAEENKMKEESND